MPFKKRILCSNISLIVSAGLFLSSTGQIAVAQIPQFSCRANNAGDGWICEPLGPRSAPVAPSVAPPSGVESAPIESDDSVSPQAVEPDAEVEPAEVPLSNTSSNTSSNTNSQPRSATNAVNDNGLEEIPASPSNDNQASSQALATAAPLVPTAIVSEYPLDWVPREALSQEQLQLLPDNCCGAFIDPSRSLANFQVDPETAQTVFSASQGIEQLNQNLITIDGDVVVQQGNRHMQNDSTTTLDRGENTVLMEGNVVFREPGILLQGTSAFVNSDAGTSRMESASYVIHDVGAHGQAESVVYTSESGLVSIENGEFSRCEPENSFWKISARSLVLDQANGRGYATGASLRLGNFPIFYYPYTLPFPLGDERMSGFLAPSTGSTRSGGFDFELPYYLNLAPNYDATVSPRLISDRGVLTSLETRYLASWSMNTLNMSYLGNDKFYDPDTVNIPGTESPSEEDRWFIGYEHLGNLGRNWSTFVDYNAISDDDYFYDLGSNGLNVTSRTHLNQLGQLNFNSGFLRANLRAQRTEIIDPTINTDGINKPYDRLPQFNFDTDAYLPGGFGVRLRGQITSFDRTLDATLLPPSQIENGVLVTGERINLEPEINWSLESPGWFVRASGKYKYAAFDLQEQASVSVEDPDIGIGVGSADAGLIFERQRAGGGSQTLEPRLFYLYSEFENQDFLPLFDTTEMNFSFNQLFRDDRFSGGDRIADANQLSAALTTRLLDERGRELGRASIGRITYFEDRYVSLKSPLRNSIPKYSTLSTESALAGELGISFGDNWRLSTDVQWNEETEEIEEGSFRMRYQGDADHILNLSYRYRGLATNPNAPLIFGIDTRIKQSDVSGMWPINDNWKILARWNYDHSNDRNLETFAGIEYSNCCATIRLVGREWVDENELFLPNIEPNRGIFVQFTLNGLGNITGGGISSLLEDGIWGFRETEYE